MLISSGSRLVASRRVRELDRRVEEPGEHVALVEHRLRAVVEVVGELAPDLGADLLAACSAMATLPVRRPGVSQSETSTERMPSHAPVAVAREVDVAPELGLRDRRQRPLGVDVDRVAVDERHVAVEVEQHAVHPARDEAVERRQAAARARAAAARRASA